jgi:hypothetical protein
VKKEVGLLFEEPFLSSEGLYCVELVNVYDLLSEA